MTLLQRRLNSVPCTLQLLTEHGPPVDSFVQVVRGVLDACLQKGTRNLVSDWIGRVICHFLVGDLAGRSRKVQTRSSQSLRRRPHILWVATKVAYGEFNRAAAWLLSGSPPVRTSRCQFVVQFIATGFHVVSMVKPGKD